MSLVKIKNKEKEQEVTIEESREQEDQSMIANIETKLEQEEVLQPVSPLRKEAADKQPSEEEWSVVRKRKAGNDKNGYKSISKTPEARVEMDSNMSSTLDGLAQFGQIGWLLTNHFNEEEENIYSYFYSDLLGSKMKRTKNVDASRVSIGSVLSLGDA
ncbi:hypothetical protein ACFE04_001155 [Oxalis oulophora]